MERSNLIFIALVLILLYSIFNEHLLLHTVVLLGLSKYVDLFNRITSYLYLSAIQFLLKDNRKMRQFDEKLFGCDTLNIYGRVNLDSGYFVESEEQDEFHSFIKKVCPHFEDYYKRAQRAGRKGTVEVNNEFERLMQLKVSEFGFKSILNGLLPRVDGRGYRVSNPCMEMLRTLSNSELHFYSNNKEWETFFHGLQLYCRSGGYSGGDLVHSALTGDSRVDLVYNCSKRLLVTVNNLNNEIVESFTAGKSLWECYTIVSVLKKLEGVKTVFTDKELKEGILNSGHAYTLKEVFKIELKNGFHKVTDGVREYRFHGSGNKELLILISNLFFANCTVLVSPMPNFSKMMFSAVLSFLIVTLRYKSSNDPVVKDYVNLFLFYLLNRVQAGEAYTFLAGKSKTFDFCHLKTKTPKFCNTVISASRGFNVDSKGWIEVGGINYDAEKVTALYYPGMTSDRQHEVDALFNYSIRNEEIDLGRTRLMMIPVIHEGKVRLRLLIFDSLRGLERSVNFEISEGEYKCFRMIMHLIKDDKVDGFCVKEHKMLGMRAVHFLSVEDIMKSVIKRRDSGVSRRMRFKLPIFIKSRSNGSTIGLNKDSEGLYKITGNYKVKIDYMTHKTMQLSRWGKKVKEFKAFLYYSSLYWDREGLSGEIALQVQPGAVFDKKCCPDYKAKNKRLKIYLSDCSSLFLMFGLKPIYKTEKMKDSEPLTLVKEIIKSEGLSAFSVEKTDCKLISFELNELVEATEGESTEEDSEEQFSKAKEFINKLEGEDLVCNYIEMKEELKSFKDKNFVRSKNGLLVLKKTEPVKIVKMSKQERQEKKRYEWENRVRLEEERRLNEPLTKQQAQALASKICTMNGKIKDVRLNLGGLSELKIFAITYKDALGSSLKRMKRIIVPNEEASMGVTAEEMIDSISRQYNERSKFDKEFCKKFKNGKKYNKYIIKNYKNCSVYRACKKFLSGFPKYLNEGIRMSSKKAAGVQNTKSTNYFVKIIEYSSRELVLRKINSYEGGGKKKEKGKEKEIIQDGESQKLTTLQERVDKFLRSRQSELLNVMTEIKEHLSATGYGLLD